VAGHAVTFTAALSAAAPAVGTPTGAVRFSAAEVTLCAAAPVVNGEASCATTALPVGDHTVTASYAGEAGFGPAARSVAVTVDPVAGTILVSPAGTRRGPASRSPSPRP
jgi:hypothetical protein